ncbi:hypothetical protein ACET3Z_011082 [Daucus carota]
MSRKGWSTNKDVVPFYLKSPTVNLNERDASISPGPAFNSGTIPVSAVCNTPFNLTNVMKLNQGLCTTGTQKRSAKRRKGGDENVLPQHPSNSLNHLNSPVLNFEERSASCMTDQSASISTRPPLSDVSNTAVNIHSRMDLNEGDKDDSPSPNTISEDYGPMRQVKAKKSKTRIPPTDKEGTSRQLFGIRQLNDDATIEHSAIASVLEDADQLFNQNGCETDYAEPEVVDNVVLPAVQKALRCNTGYVSLGPPTECCSKCKALMWKEERVNKTVKNGTPEFSLCCSKDLGIKMMFNKFQKLQNLHTDKTEWTIRARAQSIWEGINRATNEFKGLNVMLIDDSSTRIHAFLNAKISDFFKEDLKEGNIYRISNFHVKKYEGPEKNRVVRNEKHIYFDNYTKLVAEKTNATFFPTYAFDLYDLEDASRFVTDERFLIDVVGVITNKNVERVYSKDDNTRSHIRFVITDGSCELRVTFFNELAEQLEKQLKHTAEEQKKYKCQVSVKKVEEKTNWYDNVCTSCDEEVNIVEGRYKCDNCKRNIPFPDKRFRLATVCNDSTGYLGIVFPDEEIQRITGKNVGDSISFPPLLKAFEKKEFIVTLIIGETNVHNSCNVYLAHAIDEPPEMLGDHVPGEVVPANSKQDSISMNLEETLNRASDSPATEKSTNKQRPRKKTDTVPFETEENVKKRKTVKKDIVRMD